MLTFVHHTCAMNKKELLVLVLMIVAISTRFIFIVDGQSIIPNFTAVAAIAILGASHLRGVKKWFIPLVILWASDLILNNVVYPQYYDSFQVFGSTWVYSAFLCIGVMAYFLLRKASWGKLLLTSTLGAVLFFLITNFGSWINPTSPYVKDLSGLMASYTAGVPFFRNAILGDIFFSFVLFGAYEFFASKMIDVDSIIAPKAIA